MSAITPDHIALVIGAGLVLGAAIALAVRSRRSRNDREWRRTLGRDGRRAVRSARRVDRRRDY